MTRCAAIVSISAALFFLATNDRARADSSVPSVSSAPSAPRIEGVVHIVRGKIDPNDRAVLDAVIATLKGNLHITSLRVDGHTDARGDDQWNMRQSQARADLVAHELVAGGVASSRVETKAFGESRPLDPAATPAAWAKNSRVEFTVLAVDGKPIAHR